MLACVDVAYREDSSAAAACVLFRAWSDDRPADSRLQWIARVERYEPGQFYRRELPGLLAVLGPVRAAVPLEAVVVDGYVWLDDEGRRPGLGAHLHEALGRTIPVVGVAKRPFASNRAALEVLRGASRCPLFVTAVGIAVDEAAQHVREMHGAHRIPTLLALVDRISREAVTA